MGPRGCGLAASGLEPVGPRGCGLAASGSEPVGPRGCGLAASGSEPVAPRGCGLAATAWRGTMARMSAPRLLAILGTALVGVAVLIMGVLHVVPPTSEISPYRRTISQYALTEAGGTFNVAVLLLAAGSVATMLAIVGAGLVPARSGGVSALLLWSVALAAVVYFPKHNWAVGPSMDGTVHRFASVVAFLSLPAGALLIGRSWWAHPRWRVHARWTWGLGLWSLLCLTPILAAIVVQPWTGVAWWRAIPLGAVERVLAISEIGAVLALAWWAASASVRGPVTIAPPGPGTDRAPAGSGGPPPS